MAENIHAIQQNLFQNELRRLNSDGIGVVLVFINRSADPAGIEGAFITIHDEDQIPRALEQISGAIAGQAPQ